MVAQKRIMTVQQLIAHHKINKAHLAARIGMPIGTLKNKLYDNLPAYKLTDEEHDKILSVLNEMATDIQKIKPKG